MHKVEKILRNQKFGFNMIQGGFFQLTKQSTTSFRSDGTPFYDSLPGLISPQIQDRILTYARDEREAATHFIAVATQQVTDPILADEPANAPTLDMEALERVAGTIAENKLADAVAAIRADNQKQIEAVLAENAKLRSRLDELEAPTAEKPKGKAKGKGNWRDKPAPSKEPAATGKPPEPPIEFGVDANSDS
jgi:hypothetical protein